MSADRFILADSLWIVTEPAGAPAYDFNFRQFFDCRTPFVSPAHTLGIARIGPIPEYQHLFEKLRDSGIRLVHSPDEHERCSNLPLWYPLIETLTPRSRWYEGIPTLAEIESEFEFPLFIKGSRQTSRHSAASIVRTSTDFKRAMEIFRTDPILHWQDLVCREFVKLRPVAGGRAGKVPAAFEFRTFWWRGQLVGEGRYWRDADPYSWSPSERDAALAVAAQAVAALGCAFPVIDLAQRESGEWIVIECNDGMESGYAAAPPISIWQAIVDIERTRGGCE